jgi:hypothetical protein
MAAEDIVPITQGNLRAFMYENYAKGQEDERKRIIAYLKAKGVIRDAFFFEGLVARAEYLGDDEQFVWHSIDLPTDLGATEKVVN